MYVIEKERSECTYEAAASPRGGADAKDMGGTIFSHTGPGWNFESGDGLGTTLSGV